MAWSEERLDILKRGAVEGLSASQIAKRIGGITRNSVCGKAYRLGISLGGTPSRSKGDGIFQSTAPRRVKPCKPKKQKLTFGANGSLPRRNRAPGDTIPTHPVPPVLAPFDGLNDISQVDADPPENERIALLDLKHGQCKWPISGKFCGRPACDRGPGSYCEAHAARAYAGITSPKKKWADDDPRRAAFAARARQTFNVAAE